MKKLLSKITIIALIFTLLLTCIYISPKGSTTSADLVEIARDNNVIFAKPKSAPNGKTLIVNNAVSFVEGTYHHIENDDWDWDTMSIEHKIIQEENNLRYSLKQVGGNYHPSFEFWLPAVNILGSSAVSVYVDFSKLKNPTEPKLQLRIQISVDGLVSNLADLEKIKSSAGNYYVYDYSQAEWVENTTTDGVMLLPDGYRGYVYMPLTMFDGLTINGVGIDTCYIQMYHLDIWTADMYDNTSEIILDDFDLVSLGESHTHQFTNYGKVLPTCTQKGYSLQKCSCGQVKWENVENSTGHTLGDKYYHTENTSFACCSVCDRLEYFNEISETHLQGAKKISYKYLGEGLTDLEAEYPNGYTLSDTDILYEYKAVKGIDEYQFFRFTSDIDGLYGCKLVDMSLNQDLTVYAQYNFSSYDGEKFRAMCSDIAFNGGPYATSSHLGKIIFMGNSNYSLWHNMEGWYAGNNLPVLNNSVAGSSSYNYVEYIEELILMYQPKIVITGISTNDLSYHQMSDKVILGNMAEVYNKIQHYQPGTPVILIAGGLLPGRPEYFTAVRRINSKLKTFCEQNEYAYYHESDQDAAWNSLLEYPNGWESWTHRGQEACQKTLGENLLPVIQAIMQERNISF